MGGTGRRRTLLDDLGAAIAAAVAPHRFLGLLLVLVAPLTALDGGPSAPTWAACSGFVAGALLASWRLVLVTTLPAIGWLVGMALPPSSLSLWGGACGAAGAVAGAAKRPSRTASYGALAITAAVAAVLHVRGVENAHAAFGVVALSAICAALVAASGRLLLPAVAVLVTTFLCVPDGVATWPPPGAMDAAWIGASAALLAAIAGRTHAALREGRTDGQEAAARLVVHAQLSPWRTCFFLGALFLSIACVMQPGGHEEARIARIGGLAMAGGFLHHVARGARAPFDRTAAVAVALALAWPLADVVFEGRFTGLAEASLLLLAPQAIARILDLASDRDPRRMLLLTAGAATVMPSPEGVHVVYWLLAVACTFHLVVLSDVPARRVFWWAAACGIASGLLRTQVEPTRHPVTQVAEVVGLWLVGATLALAARRTRMMTAVPDDHAVRADFDVHAERASA